MHLHLIIDARLDYATIHSDIYAMFIDCLEASTNSLFRVKASKSISSLYESDLSDEDRLPHILCLLGALRGARISEGMSVSTWPIDLIQNLKTLDGNKWLIAHGSLREEQLTRDDFETICNATGMRGKPRGNVRCTLPIRRYDERNSTIGGIYWLEQLIKSNNSSAGIILPLLLAIKKVMIDAKANGADLFLEQISMVIAKDPLGTDTCLTPRLHADEYYGFRETAVASLIEEHWSPNGGTWFLPTCTMQDYPDGNTIKPSDLLSDRFQNVPIVYSSSGDLCIYDGMLDEQGTSCANLGLPHISSDIPGRSSRLVLLFHHRRPEKREHSQNAHA